MIGGHVSHLHAGIIEDYVVPSLSFAYCQYCKTLKNDYVSRGRKQGGRIKTRKKWQEEAKEKMEWYRKSKVEKQ